MPASQQLDRWPGRGSPQPHPPGSVRGGAVTVLVRSWLPPYRISCAKVQVKDMFLVYWEAAQTCLISAVLPEGSGTHNSHCVVRGDILFHLVTSVFCREHVQSWQDSSIFSSHTDYSKGWSTPSQDIIQNRRVLCWDSIMLILKMAKLFHFQRTLMQRHSPCSSAHTDLPTHPPSHTSRAGGTCTCWEGTEKPEPLWLVPAWTTHPQLLTLHRRRGLWGWSLSSTVPLPWEMGDLKLSPFFHHSPGTQLRPLSNLQKVGEGGILTGRAQHCCGFRWHSWGWDL